MQIDGGVCGSIPEHRVGAVLLGVDRGASGKSHLLRSVRRECRRSLIAG